jgi:hypothetical protein
MISLYLARSSLAPRPPCAPPGLPVAAAGSSPSYLSPACARRAAQPGPRFRFPRHERETAGVGGTCSGHDTHDEAPPSRRAVSEAARRLLASGIQQKVDLVSALADAVLATIAAEEAPSWPPHDTCRPAAPPMPSGTGRREPVGGATPNSPNLTCRWSPTSRARGGRRDDEPPRRLSSISPRRRPRTDRWRPTRPPTMGRQLWPTPGAELATWATWYCSRCRRRPLGRGCRMRHDRGRASAVIAAHGACRDGRWASRLRRVDRSARRLARGCCGLLPACYSVPPVGGPRRGQWTRRPRHRRWRLYPGACRPAADWSGSSRSSLGGRRPPAATRPLHSRRYGRLPDWPPSARIRLLTWSAHRPSHTSVFGPRRSSRRARPVATEHARRTSASSSV